VRVVLFLLGERLGFVGQRAVGDAETAGNSVARAQLEDLSRRRRVRLDVPIGLSDRLVDAAEVWLAVRRSGRAVGARLNCHAERQGEGWDDSESDDRTPRRGRLQPAHEVSHSCYRAY